MQTYRVETTIASRGTLTIEGLPFQAGDRVEVVVRSCQPKRESSERYPLRGKEIGYVEPFGTVAGEDWDALR